MIVSFYKSVKLLARFKLPRQTMTVSSENEKQPISSPASLEDQEAIEMKEESLVLPELDLTVLDITTEEIDLRDVDG